KLLCVDQRPVHDVHFAHDGNERAIEIEQRHVAAGAAIEPDGRELQLLHGLAPPLCSAKAVIVTCERVISSTPLPLSASAPVGQARTHLPQSVQMRASPHFWFRSGTMRA